MPRLSTARSQTGNHLKPSAFIAHHGEFAASRLDGPIADIACGSGRNLLPFLHTEQSIECFDIRANSLDPYIVAAAGSRLSQHEIDLLKESFCLQPSRYGLILLVHFYSSKVLSKVVPALKPGGLLILETIDDRGGNYHQLPHTGEVLQLLTASIQVLSCQITQAGPDFSRQVVRLLGQRVASQG